jgi:hypothetical protein
MRHTFVYFRALLSAAAILVAFGASAFAQDLQGSISGNVTDPQDAMIPAASVVVTNAETGAVRRTQTDAAGRFEVNLLNPGTYTVTVEAAGFKKLTRGGLQVQVSGHLDVPLALAVGQVTESMVVTAGAPLLDTTSADNGRTIDRRQIMELPFADANPFLMASLAAGMSYTGNPKDTKPFDNSAVSAFQSNGGVGQNEYTIDGAPATGTGRQVGFVPSSDAVEEFKLQTTSFDATLGHTSEAVINVMLKAGTNSYHGNLTEAGNQQRWNATSHFTREAYYSGLANGSIAPGTPEQGSGRTNDFGGSFGGPVYIPKLFNGRNKLFFFVNYAGIYKRTPQTTSATVPTPAWEQGDFSDLLKVDATKYTIYDPRSASLINGHVTRLPFPGNKGIPTLNPMAPGYEALYPKPNYPVGLATKDDLNDFYSFGATGGEDYNALVNRYDANISDKHRLFVSWYRSRRHSTASDWNTAKPGLEVSGIIRHPKGIGGDYIWTIDSRTAVDVGLHWTSYATGNERPVQTASKPSDFGLPAYLDAKAGNLTQVPTLTFSSLNSLSDTYPTMNSRGNTGQLRAAFTTQHGSHSFKYGYEERRYWFGSSGPGYTSGRFTFSNSYVRQADNTTTASNQGLEFAAFLMGLPSGISIDTNDSGEFSTRYRAFYFQDDWRITSKLHLSPGLRYEREGGITERFNRGLAGGFLYGASLPFSSAMQAAYAANPIPELAASQFQALGGTQYLGTNGNSTYTNGTNKILPRLGVAYELTPKTVVRAGYGWFYDTFNVNNTQPSQLGYSQPTSTTVSTDNGLTFCCGGSPLNNPFPVRADGTRFNAPYGNALGLVAYAGQSLTFTSRDFSPAWEQRWRVSVQRTLTRDLVVDLSYNGAYSKIPVNQPVNYVPQQYWATGNTRNATADDNLNQNVANPFNIKNLAALQASNPALYNYLATFSTFSSSTIRKSQLLSAFPQYTSLTGLRPGVSASDSMGRNKYRDVEIQLEKRYANGLQMAVMYTYARGTVRDYYANPFDARPSWETNNLVLPHRFVWSSIYALPFGKGRRWLSQGPARYVAGGWQLSWIYEYQMGAATSWGNVFYYGDPGQMESLFKHGQIHGQNVDAWFDPTIAYKGSGSIPSGFVGFEGRSSQQPGQYQVRTFPRTLDAVRADGLRNWDARILRRFQPTEHLRFTFSLDLLNLTNHTNFGAPVTDPTSSNFGLVTSQIGNKRVIQYNFRFDF